jgi:hypothetical protein
VREEKDGEEKPVRVDEGRRRATFIFVHLHI